LKAALFVFATAGVVDCAKELADAGVDIAPSLEEVELLLLLDADGTALAFQVVGEDEIEETPVELVLVLLV
jgi:hypothetical protein